MADSAKGKQKIEDVVVELLSGAIREGALDFIAYLREKKISISQTYPDTWRANYKGKSVCRIILRNDNTWALKPNDDFKGGYPQLLADEKIREAALANVRVKACQQCNSKCADGVNAIILGVDYEKICKHYYVYFVMPDAQAVMCAKKIVEIRCDEITAVSF